MKKKYFIFTFISLFIFLSFAYGVKAEEAANMIESEKEKATTNTETISQIAVAIIDFETKAPGNPELGGQISDILTARLSIYDQFQLVERKKLHDVIAEQKLNLTGMVDSNHAIQLGKVLGARIMIFGKAFPVDKDLYIVAKIVGTETSMVKGVMAKGKLEGELSDILDQLIEKLVEGMEQWTPQLLPKSQKFVNKISAIKEQLHDKELPTVAVIVPEIHITRNIIDPAAETEVKKILEEAGFPIIDVKGNKMARWARDFMADPEEEDIPDDLSKVDILIVGEGFSEFASRINDLYSCTARLEISMIQAKENKTILSERTTKRAVDLSELISSKNALQAAGNEIGMKIIEKLSQEILDKPLQCKN